MSDVISRQAVIDQIIERQRKLIYCFGLENDVVKIMDIAKSIVIAISSAELEQKCESCRYHNLEWDDEPCDSCTMGGEGCHYKPERKKGKWIWQIENRYICSECGHHTQVDELFEEPMYAFCPYCSTSMLDEDGNVRYER